MNVKVPMDWLANLSVEADGFYEGYSKNGGLWDSPILDSNFIVMINTSVMGFQSISGITNKIELDCFVEGGRNQYPIRTLGKNRGAYEMTFSRGYIIRKLSATDLLGIKLGSASGIEEEGIGIILLMDSGRNWIGAYVFATEGMKSWTLGDLDATSGQRLIETYTITHHGVYSIPTVYYNRVAEAILGKTYSNKVNGVIS